MGSHKPRSAVDALPIDYTQPRGPRREQHDPLGPNDGTLVIPVLTEEEQAERRAAALRYLHRRGAEDLIDMLGLGPESPTAVVSASPSSVLCPECPARISETCISSRTGKPWSGYHLARRRRANQEQREQGAAA